MRALLVTPDYASHYLPLSALGLELQRRGHHVVVASGPALAQRVEEDGFEHRTLVLGAGSNPGLIRSAEQVGEEASHLDGFLAATRAGMVATLRFQAEARLHDLLWEPEAVTGHLGRILADVRPDVVAADQLAFGATLALRALERPYVAFHPGHPSAIPGPGELFGFPHLRPRELDAGEAELAQLWRLCAEVSDRFTDTFNRTLRSLNPRAPRVVSALSATSSTLTLLNYPAELGEGRRGLLPRSARFVGASVRDVPAPDLARLLAETDTGLPRIYVSLGSFLSARTDVLHRIVAAFREEPVQLLLASGVTPPDLFGDLPPGWHVRPYLPQPAALRACDLVLTHGGNNTVTEALWAGVPLLVAPFSTDQFAGAEDVRRAGLGDVFDPNRAPPPELAARARAILTGEAPRRAAALGARLRAEAGPRVAADLVEQAAPSMSASSRRARRRRPATPAHSSRPG